MGLPSPDTPVILGCRLVAYNISESYQAGSTGRRRGPNTGINRAHIDSSILPSAFTPCNSNTHTIIPTAFDRKDVALERLVGKSLPKKRLQSDHDGTWVAELDWMHVQT